MTQRWSSVGLVQQVIVVGLAAAAFACWWLLRDTSPVLALLTALAVAFVHAWVLGLEFALMRWASAGDLVPPAGGAALLRAWWRESVEGVRVFGWRQPFAWRAVPDHWQPVDPARVGIVFVHGFMCNRGFWAPWMREAIRRGHACAAVNLEPMDCSIDDYADTIERAVDAMAAGTGRAPVLVCHSMGGLAARAWLRRSGDPARVAHLLTIGSPHAGTWLARLSRRANGLQMRIGCDWLRELGGSAPDPSRTTCWYSDADNIVFPPSAATLPRADNRLVHGAGHVEMAFRPHVMQSSFELIGRL